QSHAVYYDKHVTRMRRKINTRFALSPCMIRRLLTTSCQDLGGLGPAVSGNTERPHADRTDARQSDEAKRCCGAADRMADSAADRRLLRGLGDQRDFCLAILSVARPRPDERPDRPAVLAHARSLARAPDPQCARQRADGRPADRLGV